MYMYMYKYIYIHRLNKYDMLNTEYIKRLFKNI